MTLDELANKYGTDKSSQGHFYTRHYEKFFSSIRFNVESVLELGIASGASLQMWRDYFPDAIIYGVDQNFVENVWERIVCCEFEQTNTEELRAAFHDKKLEIIIDDASHDPDKTMTTLDYLFPLLEPNGWYVIEDMDRNSFSVRIGEWMQQHSEVEQLHIISNKDHGSNIVFLHK